MKKFFLVLALFLAPALAHAYATPTFGVTGQKIYNSFGITAPSGTYEFTTSTTSTQVYPANQARTFLQIQNKSATIAVYVKLGSAQTTATEGYAIAPSGTWAPVQAPTNSIFVESASGTPVISIIEGR